MTAEEKKRRFWKRVIILAIAWIFVLPLIAFVVFGVIGLLEANAPVASQPQVPNLKGLQIETAQKTSHQAGFQVEVTGKDIDSGEKPGTVINQEPWAGSSYPAGTTISVLIAEKDPNADFWEEQRRIHQDYERRGFFKEWTRPQFAVPVRSDRSTRVINFCRKLLCCIMNTRIVLKVVQKAFQPSQDSKFRSNPFRCDG